MAQLRSLERELSYQPIPLFRDQNSSRSVKLDLNSLCIKHPKETFLIQVKNPNLIAWGIEMDDLLVVEKRHDSVVNDLLVLHKNGEYKFYQFFSEMKNKEGKIEKILFSLDVREPNLRIQEWSEIQLAGIITNVVHPMQRRRHSPFYTL